MRLGVGIPAKSTDQYNIPQRHVMEFVRRAESYGFAGAWAPEHLTRPPSYQSSFHDPLTTLATVAGATDRLDVGTCILILPMRHPVLVAKRAATIQHFSDNRLTLGLGQGYLEDEYDAVDVPFAERHARFTEAIELLSLLLTENEVTYDGEFFQTEDLTIEPTLHQPPRLLVAGGGRERDGEWRVADAVVDRIDAAGGWISSSSSHIEKDWGAIARGLEERGTDPGSIHRVGLQHIHLEPGDDREVVLEKQHKVFAEFVGEERGLEWADEHYLVGTIDDIKDHLSEYRDHGFHEVILSPAAHTASEVHRQLDLWKRHLYPAFY